MKFKTILAAIIIGGGIGAFAGETEYWTGGTKFRTIWKQFYKDAVHEPDIDDPLIKAGKAMVPTICAAIKNEDMKYRRYAIGALGYIGDKRAINTLTRILSDLVEEDYFRADALRAIYQIDKSIAKKEAKSVISPGEALEFIITAIEKDQPWLTEKTVEQEPTN